MLSSQAIRTITDLNPFLITSDTHVVSSKARGLVIVPGGGGKTTLVQNVQQSIVSLADIDDYWDREEEKDKVQQLIDTWNDACQKNDLVQRRQIEDEYVLLKAQLSKTKWATESTTDLLFIQTCGQAFIILNDHTSIALNLLPTARLHHENIYRRAAHEHPPRDIDVCQRQWQENYERCPHISYDNFDELHRLITLFHQLILIKRTS